jgi:hypothetical protein
MPKYGRGLNREIVGAVNSGMIAEPFDLAAIRSFAAKKGWRVPDTFLNVALANGCSQTHSGKYKKYFQTDGDGKYRLRSAFRGKAWS